MAASGKRSTRKVEASTQSDNTMLTIDDVRAIPLFSTLAATELQRLAATSADLHLGAGEFAVPEGGDRALYAVLAGKMQVVKLVDGIERTLGWRVPGQILVRCQSPWHHIRRWLSRVGTVARPACRSEGVLRRCGGGHGCLARHRQLASSRTRSPQVATDAAQPIARESAAQPFPLKGRPTSALKSQ